MAAIDSLLEAGINTAIRTTLVQGNKDEYDQLSDFARQRSLMLGVVNYISPRREGEANSDPIGNRLSSKDLVQYEIHVAERNEHLMLLQEDIECESTDPGGDEFAAPRGVPIRDPDDPFKCTAGKSSAWITWDGRLIPCGLMSRPEADPLKNGFQNAWEEIKQYCSAIAVCEECSQCQYESVCDHCPARLLTETGDHARAAHYLCEVAKERWNHGFK